MKTSYRNTLPLVAAAVILGACAFFGIGDPLTGGAVFAMAAAASTEPERLRKITLGTISAQPDIEKLLKMDGKRMDCADIFGVATKAKPGSSDFGPFVAFLGSFRAVNLQTKEIFESSKIIFPQFIEEELFGAFGEGGVGNVEFAFRISAKYDKDAATKYVYEMKSLLPVKENAQLSGLLDRVKEAAKALPAPRT
jgi:hypothetical protein